MAALSITCLLLGVAGAVGRPFRLPAWVVPVAAAIVVVAAGALTLVATRHALALLRDPLAFLLAAVPLAVLLDRLGFFSEVAGRLIQRSRSVGGLWVLAALVTTVLNLDAAVVLLTPLYVSIARRTGRDPLVLAAQPVLLACLASSALPVSNLTNLIAAAATGAGTRDFLTHLGLPSLVAVGVGWWRYRGLLAAGPRSGPADTRASSAVGAPLPAGTLEARTALVVGGTVVTLVLVGFTAGRVVGIVAWEVAVGADLVLLGVSAVRGLRAGRPVARPSLPWRSIPVGTALVAGALAVLAAAAVGHLGVGHLRVGRFIGGSSVADLARTAGVAAAGANLVNNLPTLLVALPAAGHGVTPALWALLLGVNMGPVVLATGSLASLLWLDALRRLGVPVRSSDFTRIGLRVGLPAAVAGVGTALALAGAGLVR